MQTFICEHILSLSASRLDNKRLGKQRVETIQIAMCLLEKETQWKNHPAIRMWRGYEKYLVYIYLSSILTEWDIRGFNSDKCKQHYTRLMNVVKDSELISPPWLNDLFINAHRSNLIRKDATHYQKFWPMLDGSLEYIWPK